MLKLPCPQGGKLPRERKPPGKMHAAQRPHGHMRARKHAIVLVPPRNDGDSDGYERHIAVMRRAVREYVSTTQLLQLSGSDVNSTRLLLSLNLLVGNGRDPGMAPPVTISGQARHVPRQICEELEVWLKNWKTEEGNGGVSVGMGVVRLLGDLAQEGFEVSIISPADALTFGNRDECTRELGRVLEDQKKLEFIMLRDEDERSDVTSVCIVELLRAIKSCRNRQVSIRQVEEPHIELQGIVKGWLYDIAPVVNATLQLPTDSVTHHTIALGIRSSYLLLDDHSKSECRLPLRASYERMQFGYFVYLRSVHPIVLIGCPLHARALPSSVVEAEALHRHLRDKKLGMVLACLQESGERSFFLLVASTDVTSAGFLMYKLASAEEILLPRDEHPSRTADEEKIAAMVEKLAHLPVSEFNPFRNRSRPTEPSHSRTNPVANNLKLESASPLPASKRVKTHKSRPNPLQTSIVAPSARPVGTKRKKRL